MKNIVLIGMRGSGKSTLGEMLARKMHLQFLDTDNEIERTEKRKIPEIIEKDGWDFFRDIESKVIRQMSHLDGYVISTGGGSILRPENITNLKNNGLLIYFKTDAETLSGRIKDSDRPDLKKSLEDLLDERKELYEEYADLTFDVTDDNLNTKIKNLEILIKTYFRR